MLKPNGFVWLRGIAWMLLCGCLLACSTTVESQENRFRKNKDTIEVIAAKNLMMRDAVMTKLAGFQSEHDEIMAATGPDQPKQLARLNSRIEDYIKQVDPTRAAPPAGSKLSATPAPGSKLGGTAPATAGGKLGGNPPGTMGGTAPGTMGGGKLGGTAAPGTAPGTMGGGKLGGTAAPGTAPGTMGGTAPGTMGGGKLGGTAPGTAPGGTLGGAPAPGGTLGGTAPAPGGKLGAPTPAPPGQ